MADASTTFLQSNITKFQAKRWEIIGAQISDKITITVRISKTLIPGATTSADKALKVSQQLQQDGWTLAGFSADDAAITVDITHPLV